MALPRKTDERVEEFVHRVRASARQALFESGQLISTRIKRKYWDYLGHCLRNRSLPFLSKMISFRDDWWWQATAGGQGRHRHPGTSLTHYSSAALKYLDAIGLEQAVASDRDLWTSMREAFIQ
eukprot:1452355-Karenia_brevis.AAC.1